MRFNRRNSLPEIMMAIAGGYGFGRASEITRNRKSVYIAPRRRVGYRKTDADRARLSAAQQRRETRAAKRHSDYLRCIENNPCLTFPKVQEGAYCPACRLGRLQYPPVEDCRCFVNPPCSQCTENELTCTRCSISESELMEWAA